MFLLDLACAPLREALPNVGVYLVGSAVNRDGYRDVDVRMIVRDKRYEKLVDALGPDGVVFMALACGQYLASLTGLPIDFQIQQMSHANATHTGPRNSLGHRSMGNFAGDGVPLSDAAA